MPSPIGHGLAGLAVHFLCSRNAAEQRSLARVAILVGAALAPDLDLTLRLIDGHTQHRAHSHSIGLAALAGLSVSLLARALRLARPLRLGLFTGAAWASHLLLDYLSLDTNPPLGLMALWPLSHSYFQFPWPFFLDIGRTLEWSTVRHNAVSAVWEVVLLLPVAVAARRMSERWRV